VLFLPLCTAASSGADAAFDDGHDDWNLWRLIVRKARRYVDELKEPEAVERRWSR
jgi:hypothetical protein